MKILIVAGGTGGHLYPGIVLARELKKRGNNIFFIIRKGESGKKILAWEGFPSFELNFQGLPRRFSLSLFLFWFKLLGSLWRSLRFLGELKPDLVVGMGGYLSFPLVSVAKICSIPALIHEQNLYPGLANRFLAPLVSKIAVSFPETVNSFPREKAVYTGTPIRPEFKEITPERARVRFGFSADRFTLLIFGGSAGAHHINEVVVNALGELSPLKEKLQFLHLTGEKDFLWVKESYEEKDFKAKVFSYLEEMGFAYACADLVVSRAGASTIAEILALKKPSLLIPYPYATGRHQELQARYLMEKGYAYFILNDDFTPPVFAQYIKDFLAYPEKLKKVSTALENFNPPQATKELVNLVLSPGEK